MYPNRVFLNRGNHEDLSINLSKNFSPNFKNDTEEKFKKHGSFIFNQCQNLFQKLPLATIIENNTGFRCFVTHGGVSNTLDLDLVSSAAFNRFSFSTLSLPIEKYKDPIKKKTAEIMTDMVWSDPITSTSKFAHKLGTHANPTRNIGKLFGHDVTDEFCEKNGFNCIVRSHESRSYGFSKDHEKCYTVFSCSNYCLSGNKAAVILLNPNDNKFSEVHVFNPKENLNYQDSQIKDSLLVNFKKFLNKEGSELIKLFRQKDSTKSDSLKTSEWSDVISQHISNKYDNKIDPEHLITLRNYLCPCDDQSGTANYMKMFERDNEKPSEILEILKSYFEMLDIDGNGTISKEESLKAIKFINKTMGTEYTSQFFDSLDLNNDNEIDLDEFKNGICSAFRLANPK
jgi:Ca2+-binding EF-hand superfamily protein